MIANEISFVTIGASEGITGVASIFANRLHRILHEPKADRRLARISEDVQAEVQNRVLRRWFCYSGRVRIDYVAFVERWLIRPAPQRRVNRVLRLRGEEDFVLVQQALIVQDALINASQSEGS
jgi:hypothetical protein